MIHIKIVAVFLGMMALVVDAAATEEYGFNSISFVQLDQIRKDLWANNFKANVTDDKKNVCPVQVGSYV